MKAASIGLEIELSLSLQEINRLSNEQLGGILKFYEHNGTRRDIPFILNFSKEDKDSILVQSKPGVYFGETDRFSITLYNHHYERLLEHKSCGDRFLGSEGKVIIYQK